MKFVLVFMLTFSALSLSAQQDKPGCAETEPSYINRMEGFFIKSCEFSEFNEIEFVYYNLEGKTVRLKKAGEYRRVNYEKDKNELRSVSGTQIRANYSNAVVKIKGKSLASDNSFFTFTNNGNEVFMKIENAVDKDDKGFSVVIIEVKNMKQELVMSLQEAIDKDGKAALYGVFFDVGKSVVKPESAPALKQISDYLNANPATKIIVVGHTDNTGNYQNNIILSKERAESIKNYLISTAKIPAERLMSEGVGPLCPVASNSTEDGRKLNRRVEIVKQ